MTSCRRTYDGPPLDDERSTAGASGGRDLAQSPNSCGSDTLVWGPAEQGERTMSGRILPAGWVWTCGCGKFGAGYASEEEAEKAAEREHGVKSAQL